MSRDLPSDLTDDIAEPIVRPFLALRIELPDPVFVWSGAGTLTFDDSDGDSHDWIGAGEFGALDTVGEASDGSATGIRASLLNVPSDFRDDIADQATRGALMEVYIGSLNQTYQIVTAAAPIWKGRVDRYVINDAGSSLSVEITGESRAIDQGGPAIKRFTDEYQQRKFPGDLFFQYVPQMTEVSILWARASQSSAGIGGSGGGNMLNRDGTITRVN